MTEPERTTPTIEQRVAAGAEWLDANVPGWLDRIDLDHLDLESGCNCILGQTFGDFDHAPLVPLRGRVAHHQAAWPLGFQSRLVAVEFDAAEALHPSDAAVDAEYDALQAEWTRLILARRAASHA